MKSGGHATNPGFSSTHGVQISLTRFNTVKVNTKAQTVEIGPGLTWDDIYQRLDPYGVTVIGGRVPGVGVGGFILGGGEGCLSASRYALSISIWILSGYSFKSNQYGLGFDNVVAYELVLPNGTVTTVTEDDQDLWFSLRVSGDYISHWFPWLNHFAGRWE